MTRIKQGVAGLAIAAVMLASFGCSSKPADETKPVQAGDGSAKPSATGASGPGAAAPATATGSGKTAPN